MKARDNARFRDVVPWNHGLSRRSQSLLFLACLKAEEWHGALQGVKARAGLSQVGDAGGVELAKQLRRNHALAFGAMWVVLSEVTDNEENNDPRKAHRLANRVLGRPKLFRRLMEDAHELSRGMKIEDVVKSIYAKLDSLSFDNACGLIMGVEYLVDVWLPCLMVYDKTLVALRRQARGGDLNAIEDLLRIDKVARYDRRITEHIERFRLQGNGPAIARIERAQAGAIITTKRDSRTAVKAWFGGFAWAILRRMGEVIKPIQIVRVFNKIAQLKSGGWQRDPDLKYHAFRDLLRLYAKKADLLLPEPK